VRASVRARVSAWAHRRRRVPCVTGPACSVDSRGRCRVRVHPDAGRRTHPAKSPDVVPAHAATHSVAAHAVATHAVATHAVATHAVATHSSMSTAKSASSAPMSTATPATMSHRRRRIATDNQSNCNEPHAGEPAGIGDQVGLISIRRSNYRGGRSRVHLAAPHAASRKSAQGVFIRFAGRGRRCEQAESNRLLLAPSSSRYCSVVANIPHPSADVAISPRHFHEIAQPNITHKYPCACAKSLTLIPNP
jgi:hypothetical protein